MESILFMIFNNVFLFVGTLLTVAIIVAWVSTKLDSELGSMIFGSSIVISIVYLIFQ